jgi:C-terminal processing protease CtpA/Prc
MTHMKTRSRHPLLGLGLAALFAASLSACGGGGDGGGSSPTPPTPPPTIPPSSTLAQQCAPTNTLAPAANRTGSLDTEKRWARSYVNEAYLWYSEVPTVDPALPAYSNTSNVYASLDSYFNALLTPALTASGKRKDEFSGIYPTAEWNALSQGGVVAGYGIEWYAVSSPPPRELRIAYVDPGTPAAGAALTRGLRVLSINGVDINTTSQAGIDTINRGAFSPQSGETYTFVFQTLTGGTQTATLTAGSVTKALVQNVKTITTASGAKVGYLTFTEFLTPSEGQLMSAFSQLKGANVSDLVLDLRYNGGGSLGVASQLGYMISGGTRTSGKVFTRLQFNDKRTADNNSNVVPFIDVTSGLSGSGTSANQSLPSLNLSRVFVLTSSGSCSASEAVINALEGIDVQVIRIGRTTCGKPYGFSQKDNCGISYFPIEFKGVNQKGFGDYADGFAPRCVVADDFSKPLGDPTEGMLAAALAFRQTGACPAADDSQRQKLANQAQGRIVRHPVREGMYR